MAALEERPAPARLRRAQARLLAQADRLVALAGEPAEQLGRRAERVSGWSVGQHVEHLLLATRAVLDRLDELLAAPATALTAATPATSASPAAAATPASPATSAKGAGGSGAAGGISLSGRLVLWLNYIPRGSARATTPIQPKSASAEVVRAGWEEVRRRLGDLGHRLGEVSAARGTSRHLVFGGLRPGQWVRFLVVHNHHHLKIIRDIQEALARPGGRPA